MSENTKQEIYKSLGLIMKEVEPIAKGNSSGLNFKFRGIEAVMNSLHELFKKHGVVVSTEIVNHEYEPVETKTGTKGYHHLSRVAFDLVSCVDGSSHRIVTLGEAVDYGDKGATKTLSIALKYALLTFFMIPTEDMASEDPDYKGHDLKSGSPADPKPLTAKEKFWLKAVEWNTEKVKWFEIKWPWGGKSAHAGKTLGDVAAEGDSESMQKLFDHIKKCGKANEVEFLVRQMELAVEQSSEANSDEGSKPEPDGEEVADPNVPF